jgi:16S rRNA (uracil1498-N3)-methyltransferase
MPRFYSSTPLQVGQSLELPAGAARHVQVLRLQPQMTITLFDGLGGEYEALIEVMGRSNVRVQVLTHQTLEREADAHITLALGVPANERMDWLVEKATELGVGAIQPLMTERGVLRLSGERAEKKQAHWQAIAVAACEQCGRNRVPHILPVKTLNEWLAEAKIATTAAAVTKSTTTTTTTSAFASAFAFASTAPTTSQGERFILSLQAGSIPLLEALYRKASEATHPAQSLCIVSGAEGGLSPAEEAKASAVGFKPVTLGNRVLRAETAALAALVMALSFR